MNTHPVAATHLTAHLTEDHLTEEQFADYVIGLSTEAMDLHVEQCAFCRAEVLGMQESIGTFASAGRAWSEMQPAPPAQHFRRRALLVQMRPVAAFAAAAAVVFAVTFSTHRQADAPQHIAMTTSVPAIPAPSPVVDVQPEPVTATPVRRMGHTAPASHAATSEELAQDNAMMAAINAEITAPFAVAPDVGHSFTGQ